MFFNFNQILESIDTSESTQIIENINFLQNADNTSEHELMQIIEKQADLKVINQNKKFGLYYKGIYFKFIVENLKITQAENIFSDDFLEQMQEMKQKFYYFLYFANGERKRLNSCYTSNQELAIDIVFIANDITSQAKIKI